MKKSKKAIIIISAYLTAAILVIGGFIIRDTASGMRYQRYVENNYQHAFAELVTNINELDSALQKCCFAGTPEFTASVCTQIYGKAQSAQMAIGILPFSDYELGDTASFISKVGDYAFSISKTCSAGTSLTEEQKNNILALSSAMSTIAQEMNDLMTSISDGKLTISELGRAEHDIGESDDDSVPQYLGESFKQMESEFPEVPSLIYDGPFSEHITQLKPRLIENSFEISQEEALSAVAEFTGLKDSIFTLSGIRGGNLPGYTYSAMVDGGELYISVTLKGGIVMEMINSREVSDAVLNADEAVIIAQDFLLSHGYESLKTSYWVIENNIATINFAYAANEIICYSDLIKVSVALDNGRVIGFEAMGYIMSHHERDIPNAQISQEDAALKVASTLTILSHQMSVIPTDGKNELFCHEFKCSSEDGRHYIVYVNAVTGKEERILILIESENGTLTL